MAKYRHDDWLETQLVEKGRSVDDVADECGVQKVTIEKWRNKLNVGETHECEFCDDEFPTERGRNIHMKKNHDKSEAGFTYTCKNCGEEFTSIRSPDDEKAPSFCGQECYGESIEGENNPNKDPERREKIRETMKKVHEEGRGDYSVRDRDWMIENVIAPRDDSYLHDSPSEEEKRKISETMKEVMKDQEHPLHTAKSEYVEKTGHEVDSSWEKEVDLRLHVEDMEYLHNSDEGFPVYQLPNGRSYIPDFVVDDKVVEVKGPLGFYHDPEKTTTKAEVLSQKDDVEYIVYGTVELPCDTYVEYGELDELIKAIRE